MITLHNFSSGVDGAAPIGALYKDSQGTMWGTVSVGGTANLGAIFKLVPDQLVFAIWHYSQAYSFLGATLDGDTPNGSLTADPNGALYGSTFFGGFSDAGAVFKFVP